ncbi:TPA: flagellar basal body rod protein FlgB [bacterium]|nr:flagellar basal body rod protein FlgB [bacterium]
MFDKIFSGATMTALKQGLDTAALRQQVISDNIANVNTPGFKRSYVTFETELRGALSREKGKIEARRTHPKHIHFGRVDLSEIKGRVVIEDYTLYRNDENNVDIDAEMTDLAKNTIMYEALATRIGGKFRRLKRIITSR